VNVLKITLAAVAAAVVAGGIGPQVYSVSAALARAPVGIAAAVGAVFAGTALTPLLLPWLPGRMFSVKGALAGALVAAALVATSSLLGVGFSPLSLAAACLLIAAGGSFGAMNYTGTSTFTSLHGVEREMAVAMPWQIAGAGLAAVLWIAGGWI
jgi:hypothetical protein